MAPYDASREIRRGVAWAILMRWSIRLIGLGSTLILARILTPDDFGVVAIAMIVVHLMAEISELGTSQLLIRAKKVDRAHCDTAWTVTLLQGVLTGCVIGVLAHPAATYFKEPRIADILYVLAATAVIGGLENIGPVLLRRELDFSRDFAFNVYKKLIVFACTIGAALYFRSYWALVVGHVTGTIAGVILSFRIHPYRPRWSLAHFAEYLRFGGAIVPMRIASTLLGTTASFLVAGLGNSATMGAFRVAGDLATLFTQEIIVPMGRGLLPNYVRLINKPDELSVMFNRVVSIVALLCIPIGIGVAAVASDLVLVLLGPQWDLAAELIHFLAIGAAIFAVFQTMNNQILIAAGREKTAAILAWIRLAITAPILWAGLQLGGVVGLSQGTIVAPIIYLPFIYHEVRHVVGLTPGTLVGLLWRPAIASVVMYFGVKLLHPAFLDLALLRLIWDTTTGVLIFSVTVLALWVVVGRPRGAEQLVIDQLVNVLRRRQKKEY